jgi:hypothetical protein
MPRLPAEQVGSRDRDAFLAGPGQRVIQPSGAVAHLDCTVVEATEPA